MSTSLARVFGVESPDLVCRPSEEETADAELTFFEPDRDPDTRTTRWITAADADCVPETEWR